MHPFGAIQKVRSTDVVELFPIVMIDVVESFPIVMIWYVVKCLRTLSGSLHISQHTISGRVKKVSFTFLFVE